MTGQWKMRGLLHLQQYSCKSRMVIFLWYFFLIQGADSAKMIQKKLFSQKKKDKIGNLESIMEEGVCILLESYLGAPASICRLFIKLIPFGSRVCGNVIKYL